ncbi:DUF481 domain-containing protein [soil metagenome]
MSISLIWMLILLSCPSIFADQITLKNGDRLTGKIIKKDGDSIVIKTEAAGEVKILWSAVEKLVSDETLNIKLADGQLIKGVVETEDENITVETQNAGTIEIAKENIKIVRSNEEQAKFEAEEERLRNPGLLELWRGSVDVGFSLTTGNSSTKSLVAGTRANRETRKDKISVYANAIQASNSDSGVSITTAQAVFGGIRYDYNLSEKTFVFGSADFEYDKPQLLDLRSVFGGGFGYRAIRSDKTELDLFGGVTYNRENYSTGEKRNSAELLFGDELTYKFNDRTSLEQRLKVYPSVSDFGTFRSLLDASLLTNLNDRISWQVTVGNRFNSNPVGNAEKNDFLFSTGLRATFGRKKNK